ncbi:MAG TPA: glycosyltransferase family 2 protein, partial [Usitatibacteraceae bacterium]|nr:glycosyltransferase family 2 protein [Usitatibacteraceae bacterium]
GGVLERIPEGVRHVFVVDDACPDHSGQLAAGRNDPRVTVIAHARNLGVGAAMASGYRAALAAGADVVVKIDADGQMDPALIDQFVRPIAEGRADYTKGNRFFRLDSLKGMPVIRLLGNSLLSLVNKMSSGYWDIMDPTNGYTAIHARVLRMIPLEKLSPRYFFESDMLFRLGTLRAVVRDVPMDAIYEGAPSSLRIGKVLTDFPLRYVTRVLKRVFYAYFLRDFNAGTVQLSLGALLVLAGSAWGAWHWWESIATGQAATTGTVMLAALPILLGGQLLIAALNYDIANVPRRPLHPSLG